MRLHTWAGDSKVNHSAQEEELELMVYSAERGCSVHNHSSFINIVLKLQAECFRSLECFLRQSTIPHGHEMFLGRSNQLSTLSMILLAVCSLPGAQSQLSISQDQLRYSAFLSGKYGIVLKMSTKKSSPWSCPSHSLYPHQHCSAV